MKFFSSTHSRAGETRKVEIEPGVWAILRIEAVEIEVPTPIVYPVKLEYNPVRITDVNGVVLGDEQIVNELNCLNIELAELQRDVADYDPDFNFDNMDGMDPDPRETGDEPFVMFPDGNEPMVWKIAIGDPDSNDAARRIEDFKKFFIEFGKLDREGHY